MLHFELRIVVKIRCLLGGGFFVGCKVCRLNAELQTGDSMLWYLATFSNWLQGD